MADPRALDALRRIERALARIESAADRPAPPAAPQQDHEEYLRLREAHETLRARVSGVIDEVDRLIAAGEAR
jgi:hypothetical protein